MAYRKWTVEIDSRPHIVELETKAMGQRIIRVDGIQQVDEKKLISLGTTDEIQVDTRTGQVHIQGKKYELLFPEADLDPERAAQINVSSPQTERITLEKDPAGLSMVVDTRSGVGYFMILIGLVFLVFGGWWLLTVQKASGNLINILMPVVLILAGLYTIYSSLRLAFNRISYRVAMHELSVRQGPIPWTGNRILDPASLSGVKVQMVSHRSSNRSYARTHTYKVQVQSKDSERKVSIGEYAVSDDAHFIAEQIGKYLDLPEIT
jgi:hypothetical protein